jgi:hypothetical protein
VVDGCVIRELPDGGREFVLDEPALSSIRIDHRSTLRFGVTEVAIAAPFILRSDGVTHHLDPRRTEALGPLLALYPGAVRWLWASAEGRLQVVFEHGALVSVGPSAGGTSWSVGAVSSGPDGPTRGR